MSDIKIEGLSHLYSAGTPFEKIALNDINLEIPQGQFVGLLGHTGSGKSTLIQHLNGLLKPSSGRVLVGDRDINESKESRRDIKFRVGLVFQYPEYQLFEETVFRDIAFGPKNMGLSEQEIDERVREAAGFVGIGEELFEDSPLELSGGQKRRVAIAGVIAMRPEILILDEPTSGLDPEGCNQVLSNICRYRESLGSTVIIVSHNMDDIARISDRLIVMSKGTVAMDGTPQEVFSEPEQLKALGLNVPKSTEIYLSLKDKGINLQPPVYTHEQLKAAVLKYREVQPC